MSNDRRQILDMLANGKITADEAERLLAALDGAPSSGFSTGGTTSQPRYLRVVVDSEKDEGNPTKVNIRVPLSLVRAGVKLGALMPAQARDHVNEALREKGIAIDVNQIKPADVEAMLDQLGELTVDVDDKKAKVRVFCE
ncbi:MAG: hypothetical protein WAW96_14650 [Alphaproteobacteria bacterium]